MLRELHISGLGVIDDLDLDLHPGLNVLTGETGAGKTMVTVGLALALGVRADSSLVRTGAKAARVQARFDATEGAVEWSEDGEVLLARSVNADGKSSARVGGQLATASTLAELGGALVEVHGQHQAQRLLSSTTQTGFLDRFAGEAHLVALAAYREAWERWRDARSALEALEASTRERERELDLLAYQVNEIEAVDPSDGETERLKWVGLYPQRQGGDAFMLRVKIPGGRLTAAQARLIGEIADEHARGPEPNPIWGDGYLDLTTRQDIQLHWIKIGVVPEIWQRLEDTGITTVQACGDSARNVSAGSLAWLEAPPTIVSPRRVSFQYVPTSGAEAKRGVQVPPGGAAITRSATRAIAPAGAAFDVSRPSTDTTRESPGFLTDAR